MFGHVNHVDVFFEIIVLLFAICVHESAHAWMANRLGDPTAKMLGRISLNPIVHIDPFGTIIMPLFLIVLGFPPFGWAKPTPVDTRNFKNLMRDDILTAVAGPVAKLFSYAILINVVLGVFNLIPLPPLDGSHVIRHFLSYDTLRIYDRIGYIGLVIVLFILPMVGCSIVGTLTAPFLAFFYALLGQLLRI